MNKTIISAEGLTRIFNAGRHNEVKALNEVNLAIANNSLIVLEGPSGSGKTTLLSLLSCLDKPTSGRYTCLGQEVSHWSEKFLTRFRRAHLGIVFQNFSLIESLTARQNIALPMIPENIRPGELNSRVDRIAELLQISHRLEFKVRTLSGGELERVAIARALVNDPQILLADEPTAHLDSHLARDILDIFAALKEQGKTIIIATHDPLVINHSMVDKRISMRDGQLREDDAG